MERWGEKRYHSLDYALRSQFGEKVYKIALNGGMTCPNRDGTIGDRGCIFCSPMGSGDFAGSSADSISAQLKRGKSNLSTKRPIHSYIAYFQAFTNTYGSISHLEKIYLEAVSDPEVKVLSIATRPDCLGPEVLALLSKIRKIKPVWIELGLQTIHEKTAKEIRRGYPLSIFEQAVQNLHARQIPVIVHTILYLPGETPEMMLQTIDYLNHCPIQGIKLQLLHVLKGTDLAIQYQQHPFHIPEQDEYIRMVGSCLSHLRPDIVIHRVTGDGPSDLMIAPLWSQKKRTVLNELHAYLKSQDIWQGKEYSNL